MKRGLEFFDALASRNPLVLAMDFDGTLAPIVERPEQARLPERLRKLLRSLAGMEGIFVAVISGRSLRDLKKRCSVKGAALVGDHGLSSTLKGIGLSVPEAVLWRAVLREAKRRLEPLRLGDSGARLEDKGLGISIHLRGMKPAAKAVLVTALARALAGLELELRSGLEVLELRQRRSWDKGLALKKFAAMAAPGWKRKGACIFAGDDSTDEDAFKALKRMGRRAMGIKIGEGSSAASLRLGKQQHFWHLLERIRHLRSS